MKQNKHVLVIVDKAEKTASRNNKSDDLIVQWTNHMNTTPLSYEVIQMGLPVGDVWFCESEEPFVIPENLKLQTTVSQTQTKIPFSSEVTNDVSENLFDLPVQTSAFDYLLLTTSDQTKSDKKKETVTNSVSSDNLPKPRIIVERKTVSDLLSSISDGRYHDQKCRLINSDAKSLMVLVEGYDSKNVKDATNKKKLLSSFSHTLFLDQICVYHTKNLTETFEFLNHTANELAAGKMERDADYYERTKYTDNIKMSRKANLTPDKGLELQLATVPGVSTKMARVVCEKYKSMKELMDAYNSQTSEEDCKQMLANLIFKGPSGKEQRLASRSEKIYCYLFGVAISEEKKAKKQKKTSTKGDDEQTKSKRLKL